jgi:hypothetical protein
MYRLVPKGRFTAGVPGPAVFQQYVLTRPVHRIVLVRAAALSADFCTAYRSLARMEGVDPLRRWAHIRRYFIPTMITSNYGTGVISGSPRRPDPYLAHKAMPAAEPATAEYAAAQAGFGQALAVRLCSWPGGATGSARAGMCATEAGGTYPFAVRLSERVSIKRGTPTALVRPFRCQPDTGRRAGTRCHRTFQ